MLPTFGYTFNFNEWFRLRGKKELKLATLNFSSTTSKRYHVSPYLQNCRNATSTSLCNLQTKSIFLKIFSYQNKNMLFICPTAIFHRIFKFSNFIDTVQPFLVLWILCHQKHPVVHIKSKQMNSSLSRSIYIFFVYFH